MCIISTQPEGSQKLETSYTTNIINEDVLALKFLAHISQSRLNCDVIVL